MCLVGLCDNLELLVVELVIKEEKVVNEFSFLALLNYLRVQIKMAHQIVSISESGLVSRLVDFVELIEHFNKHLISCVFFLIAHVRL
jgi:hypothetical protein